MIADVFDRQTDHFQKNFPLGRYYIHSLSPANFMETVAIFVFFSFLLANVNAASSASFSS